MNLNIAGIGWEHPVNLFFLPEAQPYVTGESQVSRSPLDHTHTAVPAPCANFIHTTHVSWAECVPCAQENAQKKICQKPKIYVQRKSQPYAQVPGQEMDAIKMP